MPNVFSAELDRLTHGSPADDGSARPGLVLNADGAVAADRAAAPQERMAKARTSIRKKPASAQPQQTPTIPPRFGTNCQAAD